MGFAIPLLYTAWSNAYSEIGPDVRCDLSRLLVRKITKRIHSSKWNIDFRTGFHGFSPVNPVCFPPLFSHGPLTWTFKCFKSLVNYYVKLVRRLVVSEEALAGTELPGSGGRMRLHPTLRCHHQNDSCIKMGNDGSPFNVLLIVRGKVTKTVSTNHKFWRERRAAAQSNRGVSAYQPNAVALGQTAHMITKG